MRLKGAALILLCSKALLADIHWTTITTVTPGTTGSWVDVDNAAVPDNSVGVILRITNSDAVNPLAFGLRNNGSTDNRTATIYQGSHFWAAIGCDASGIFEANIASGVTIELFGYFNGANEAFFTNAVDKSTASTSSWVDVNISSDTGANTAIGAFFEWSSTASNDNVKLRNNGSTDARTGDRIRKHMWAVIGVDGSEICEQWIDNTTADLFLLGYIKSAATFHVNATDRSLTGTATWTDLGALPAGAIGGFYEVAAGQDLTYGFRKNGSSENISNKVTLEQAYGMIECDASGIVEGIISSTTVDFWELGYLTAAPASSRRQYKIKWF